MSTPTHTELVNLAAIWLKKKHPIVVTELEAFSDTGEQADVLGISSFGSTLIEVKVSRRDFLQDKKKPFRKDPSMGMGYERYYCAPKGLIKIDEIPKDWGLLEYEDGRINQAFRSGIGFYDRNIRAEREILYSIVRRLGKGIKKDSRVNVFLHKASVYLDE